MDILAQRKSAGKLAGQVWMNGRPLGQKFKRVSAYVSQEDVFVPTMSAWETLLFHARLRTDKKLTTAEMEERMEEVLTVMGLQRVKHTVVCPAILPRDGQHHRGFYKVCWRARITGTATCVAPSTTCDSVLMLWLSLVSMAVHSLYCCLDQQESTAAWLSLRHKMDGEH